MEINDVHPENKSSLFSTFLVFQFEISGNNNRDEQFIKTSFICLKLFVFHLEISDKFFNERYPLNSHINDED